MSIIKGFLASTFGVKPVLVMALVGTLGGWGVGQIQGRAAKQSQWDDAVASAQKSKDAIEETAEVVQDNRDAEIETGKENHRDQDMVTRLQYEDLKRDKDYERQDFLRALTEARRPQSGDVCDCANQPMPSGLQRRASNPGDHKD